MLDIIGTVFGQLLDIIETVVKYPVEQLSLLSSNVL